MKPIIPSGNPRAAHCRKLLAARRVGSDAKCPCGEDRPAALFFKSGSTICARCERRFSTKKEFDDHHCFGRSNSPFTMSIPVNDHRVSAPVKNGAILAGAGRGQ